MSETRTPPDTLLLMGKQCPYCPTVLKGLQSLEATGVIGHLETVVIEDNPEIAAELGVRSVPWVRIGPFELPGLRAEEELREWAEKAGSVSGRSWTRGRFSSPTCPRLVRRFERFWVA